MKHTQIVKDRKRAAAIKEKKEREAQFWNSYRVWVKETCQALGIEESSRALEDYMDTDPVGIFILESAA